MKCTKSVNGPSLSSKRFYLTLTVSWFLSTRPQYNANQWKDKFIQQSNKVQKQFSRFSVSYVGSTNDFAKFSFNLVLFRKQYDI